MSNHLQASYGTCMVFAIHVFLYEEHALNNIWKSQEK